MKKLTTKKPTAKAQSAKTPAARKTSKDNSSQARRDALRFLVSGFMIQVPATGATVLLSGYNAGTGDGTISVRVLRLSNAAVAFLGRFDDALAGDMPPRLGDALPTDFALLQEPLTEIFKNDAAPINVPEDQRATPVAPAMAVPLKKYLKVASYDNAGDIIEQGERLFCPMPPSIRTTVSSKACIWLTFADEPFIFDQAGEHNEGTVDGYRPTAIPVPSGYNQVRIEAQAQDWQHHPTDDRRSGAAGLPGDANKMAMVKPHIYKNSLRPDLKSTNITGDTPLPLNALVALVDRGPDTATTELEVGLDRTITFTDPQPDKIHLAFHDGYEWSNNNDGAVPPVFGKITVRVTWSATVVV